MRPAFSSAMAGRLGSTCCRCPIRSGGTPCNTPLGFGRATQPHWRTASGAQRRRKRKWAAQSWWAIREGKPGSDSSMIGDDPERQVTAAKMVQRTFQRVGVGFGVRPLLAIQRPIFVPQQQTVRYGQGLVALSHRARQIGPAHAWHQVIGHGQMRRKPIFQQGEVRFSRCGLNNLLPKLRQHIRRAQAPSRAQASPPAIGAICIFPQSSTEPVPTGF